MVQVRIGDETLNLSWDEWEERVRAGRIPERALVRFEPATGDGWVAAAELEMFQSLRNDAALAWQARFVAAGPPLLTALLVGVQIRLWWVAWWTPDVARFMVRDLTLFAPPVFEDRESWRLLTMGFAQQAAFHLALNMLWLFYCGWNLERALGRANLLLLFLGSVVAGSTFSLFGDPDTPSLGASGGVYGLVAASIVFGFVRPQLLPERGRRLFGWALVPYLVLMFASGLASEDTDNWSHLGGLLAGGAMALIVDPPALQRRPGWNRAWYLGIGGAIAVWLAALAAVGPRGLPLRQVQLTLPDPALEWSTPVGWRPTTSSNRDPGFGSPIGERVWAVNEHRHERPMSQDQLVARWLELLRNRWPDAEIGAPFPTTVAGADGLGVVVRLSGGGAERILEWRGTSRGLWALESVWEVEVDRADDLAPLVARLRDRTAWNDPPSLASARIHFDHDPSNPKARDGWATALTEVGRVDEAIAIRRGLVDQFPHVAAYWSGLLDLISWYPDAVPDRAALWDRALAEHPTGAMVVAVAGSMEACGERDAARGLLDIAWIQMSGERSVRKARVARRMSLVLDDGRSWSLTHDPVTGLRRSDADVRALETKTLDVAGARAHGLVLAQEREAVITAAIDAVTAGDTSVLLGRLAWLRNGAADATDDPSAIVRDVGSAVDGSREIDWLPPAIVGAIRARPSILASARAPEAG